MSRSAATPGIHPAASASGEFFEQDLGVDRDRLGSTLAEALRRQADEADLFVEHTCHESLQLEDGEVQSATRHVIQGAGVRVLAGERQGYAHTDALDRESLRLAAATARTVAAGSGGERRVALGRPGRPARDLYPVALPPSEAPVADRAALLRAIDAYARSLDPKVVQVVASLLTRYSRVLIARSDGSVVEDARPLVRLNLRVLAAGRNGRREAGLQGGGGRVAFEAIASPERWKPMVERAVRAALANLEARPSPAGTLDVVLAPGWPGILLHEAVGHGLEGDFNRKGTSAFAGRVGERIARPGVTVVDDGTLPSRRGSLNVDDEGTPTGRTVLVEDGILRGYLQDRLNARLMGTRSTGNGRRQSYAHLPLPRMTNTFLLAGDEAPEDILRRVRSGIYAVSFGGGQVDISSGNFVFSCNEAYRIEDGRITAPLRGATLMGNGAEVLRRIRAVGCDFALDPGVGTCGKEGQAVPVGVGMPTVFVEGLTVGGTEG